MAANIIISFDGSENDHDALALGRLLSDGGSGVSIAYVRHSRESDQGREQRAQGDAQRIVDRGAAWFAENGHQDVERHVVVVKRAPTSMPIRLAPSTGPSVD